MLFEALRSLIMGAAGEALMGDRRLTPAPVEDRNPPSTGDPERAKQVHDFVRQFGGEQQAPQQAKPQGAITRPYQPTGDSSAMFRSAEPLDIAAMNEGQLMPADQVLRPDQEEFLSRKYDQQQAPQKIDSYKQLVKQKTEEELSQLPPEVRNQEGIVDKAAAYSNAALSPQLSKIEEADPELGAQIQSTMKNAFGNEEMWLRLSLAFNSLRHRPDASLANAVSSRLKTIEATKKSNRTVEMLRARGMEQEANYIEQTGDVKGGMKMAAERGEFAVGSPEMLMKQFPELQGAFPEGASGTYRYNKRTKKLEGVGQKDQYMGTIPAGYRYDPKEQAMVPMKGTKEYREWQQSLKAGETKTVGTGQSTMLVLDEIDRLENNISGWTTGFGSLLSSIPATDARNAQNDVNTIKANIGFDRLQRMREESPTGGALGQVAVQELNFLQATLGSLDLGQSADEVKYNLRRLKKQYARTLLALADAQPNFGDYFPEFNRAAYEKIANAPLAEPGKQKGGRFSTEQLNNDITEVTE